MIAGGAVGFVLARQADDDLDAEHRQALRRAIEDALPAASTHPADIDPQRIRSLERTSGLKRLAFGAEPPEGDREVQSLIDPQGRIVGWFSWEPQRPASALMLRLLPAAAIIAFAVAGFALLAVWHFRRLGSLLAANEQRFRRLAHEDPTTGLPNHHALLDRLDEALAAREADEVLGLAIVDLNSFGEVKDVVGGEAAGEDVVRALADRLRARLPPGVVISRLRSERFALMIASTDPQAALAVAEAARDEIAGAAWINHILPVSASIGLAIAPRDGATGEEIMRRAKMALRVARRRGRGAVVPFSAEMERDFDERQFIRRELARALAESAFDLHYQPIVKANGGGVVGVEALCRWHHSSRGHIPPAVFVRIAEDAGLMDRLGEFVLRRAVSDAARWPNLYVAVNLSPVQVRDEGFVALVSAILEEAKFEPSRLVLEITEGVLIDDPDLVKSRLEDLRALGVRLALDDFGAGYSSLHYLQRLPFDKLKIDRGFVAALDQWANTGVIIQAIVALGRALGMSVLIEGVETEEQRVLLRLAGCNEMQGFLFARPAPREAIDRLVAGKRAAAAGAGPVRSGK